MNASVPHLLFDSAQLESRFRQEAWIELMKPLYHVTPISNGKDDTRTIAKGWVLDDLLLGALSFDAQVMEHKGRKHSSTVDHENVFVQIYTSGGARAMQGDIPVEIHPGDVHIFDYACQRRSVSTRSEAHGVVLPYSAVGYEPGVHPGLIVIPRDSATGYTLRTLFAIVTQQLPKVSHPESATIAQMIAATVRVALGAATGHAEAEKAVAARRTAMRRYVVGRLHDLDFDAVSLAQAFGISRATVFRDFENGGLQHFISCHRLDRALHELASGPERRGRIVQAAERWGFSSHAHFSRAFRTHFGFPPSDIVGSSHIRDDAAQNFKYEDEWSKWTGRQFRRSA
jgi:AraC-like DNA-binding protein